MRVCIEVKQRDFVTDCPLPLVGDTTSRAPMILPWCFYEFSDSSEENG